MKVTLMIEGSASALAAILAALPDDGSVNVAAAPQPVAGSFPIPTMPQPTPMAAPAMPTNVGDDDDGDGAPTGDAPAFDSAGLPWDERIHSKNKGRNGDGTWRKKRGVQDATVTAVEAELRARSAPPMPAPAAMPNPVPVPSAPQPMPAPLATSPLPTAGQFPAPGYAAMAPAVPAAAPAFEAPQPVAAPVMTPPPPQPTPVAGAMEFGAFMAHISAKMMERDAAGAPLIHAGYLGQLAAEIGTTFGQQVNAITDISVNPAMIDFAVQAMQRDGRW